MRYDQPCPKCNSKNIIRIPGNIGSFGAGNNIIWGNIKREGVNITKYLCGACGYLEEWIDTKEDIEKLQDKFK